MTPTTTAIVFDLDGTLFYTQTVAMPAYRETFAQLHREGLTSLPLPPDEVLNAGYGYTWREIWERLLPGHGDDLQSKANRYMEQHELRIIKSGVGRLYPDVAETLAFLADRGYFLAVASNGAQNYVEAVLESSGIRHHFRVVAAASAYDTTDKADLVRIVLDRLGCRSGFMVGDRSSDVAAGRANRLTTIGCTYGYGHPRELVGCDARIDRFSELLRVVENSDPDH